MQVGEGSKGSSARTPHPIGPVFTNVTAGMPQKQRHMAHCQYRKTARCQKGPRKMAQGPISTLQTVVCASRSPHNRQSTERPSCRLQVGEISKGSSTRTNLSIGDASPSLKESGLAKVRGDPKSAPNTFTDPGHCPSPTYMQSRPPPPMDG